MNKPKRSTVPSAKAAYAAELRKVQSTLNILSTRLAVALGDGTLSEKIHWSNVADLQYLNVILTQALELDLSRIS